MVSDLLLALVLLVLVLPSLMLALSLSVRRLRLGSRLRRVFISARIFGSTRPFFRFWYLHLLAWLRLLALVSFDQCLLAFCFSQLGIVRLRFFCPWLLSLSRPAAFDFRGCCLSLGLLPLTFVSLVSGDSTLDQGTSRSPRYARGPTKGHMAMPGGPPGGPPRSP